MYLLDANTLMEAHDTFYPVDRIKPFWDWVQAQGEAGLIKMPHEIHGEFTGTGLHVQWINQADIKDALLLDETADPALVQKIINDGYQGTNAAFDDGEHTKYGQDPFLAAYALVDPQNRTVVTREKSKRSKRLGSTKLPDACDDCGIRWIDDFQLYKELNFTLT
jgi:hypothetical protein